MTFKKFVFVMRPMTIMVLLWTLLRVSGLELGILTPGGLTILVLTMGALIFEFVMSRDIGAVSFSRDVLFAGINLLIASALVTSLCWWDGKTVTVTDALLTLCVLADFWVGTTNSYATALRNLSGNIHQGNQAGHTEGES